MLKAKIGPITTKSNHGKVHLKAPGQPESRTQKKIKGDGAPRGGGTDPPNFCGPMTSIFGDICEKS